jgi:Tfp pilus assembly protein FimV
MGAFSGTAITTGTNIITIGPVTGVHSIFGQVDNRTYIANIRGASVDAGTAEAVFVDADGRLGTLKASAGPESSLPRSTTPKGVRPQANPEVDAMLNRKVEILEATVAQQQKGMETLTAQLKEQASQIQKVSAQIQLSKYAPQVVNNP